MATIIPRPDVKAEVEYGPPGGNTTVKVEISREGKGRRYEAARATASEAVTDVVRQILGDGYSAEWLP